jgi:acyl-coenzyme A thioesterase PaaI-like protein
MGCSSVLVDRHHAQGRMSIRRDMRLPGGALLTAPIAIAMLDTAGINIDPYYHAACTHIDVHLWDAGRNVDEIQILGTVRREARTAVFTEATFVDAAQPERVLGTGTVGWSIIGATPPGFSYRDPGPGLPDSSDLPALAAGFGAEEVGPGRFRLGGLSGLVGTEVLHHGPILVMSEAAATALAHSRGAPADLWISTASLRLVRAGRKGPFEVTAEALGRQTSAAVGTLMVDENAGGTEIATGLFRFGS